MKGKRSNLLWLLLPLLLLACNLGSSATAIPSVEAPISSTETLAPAPSATDASTLTAEEDQTPEAIATDDGCMTAAALQEKMNTEAVALLTEEGFKNWNAKFFVQEMTTESKQYKCLYAINLWGEPNPYGDKNVEQYVGSDLLKLENIFTRIYPGGHNFFLTYFDWVLDGEEWVRKQNNASQAGHKNGGLYLYTTLK